MGKGNKTGLFQDIEDGDPVLAGGFHTDFGAGVFGKPVRQLPQTFREGREAGLFAPITDTLTDGRRHIKMYNPIGAFRRKADYKDGEIPPSFSRILITLVFT